MECFKCVCCSRMTRSFHELEAHISSDHLQYLPYECYYCQFVKIPTEHYLNIHLKEQHKDREVKSIYCPDSAQKLSLDKLVLSSTGGWLPEPDVIELDGDNQCVEQFHLDIKEEKSDAQSSFQTSLKTSPASSSSVDDFESRDSKNDASESIPETKAQRQKFPCQKMRKKVTHTCALCGAYVQAHKTKHVQTFHMDKPTVFCGHCGQGSKGTVHNLRMHIIKKHPGKKINIIDRRPAHAAEIDDLLLRCFSSVRVSAGFGGVEAKIDSEDVLCTLPQKSRSVPVRKSERKRLTTAPQFRVKLKSKPRAERAMERVKKSVAMARSRVVAKLAEARAKYELPKKHEPGLVADDLKEEKLGINAEEMMDIAIESGKGVEGDEATRTGEFEDNGNASESISEERDAVLPDLDETEGHVRPAEGIADSRDAQEEEDSGGSEDEEELCWTTDNTGETVFVKKSSPEDDKSRLKMKRKVGDTRGHHCCKLCKKILLGANTVVHVLGVHMDEYKLFCMYCGYANRGNLANIKNHVRKTHPSSRPRYRDARAKYVDVAKEIHSRCFPERSEISAHTLGGCERIVHFDTEEIGGDSDKELLERNEPDNSEEVRTPEELRKSPRKLPVIPWNLLMKLEAESEQNPEIQETSEKIQKETAVSVDLEEQEEESTSRNSVESMESSDGEDENSSEDSTEKQKSTRSRRSPKDFVQKKWSSSGHNVSVCTKCGETFGDKGKREHVMKVHLGKHCMECQLCSYTRPFGPYHMKLHLRNKHGKDAIYEESIIDNREKFGDEIDQLWMECFPKNASNFRRSLIARERWRKEQRISPESDVSLPSTPAEGAEEDVEVRKVMVAPPGGVKLAKDVKLIKDRYRKERTEKDT